jgi:pSer/pThr/pTyr-binding forkhead associated (FHA) protein
LEAASSIERVVEIPPNAGEVVIGRRRGSDIELPFAAISETHARLSLGGQGWLIMDLGSANGTFVNGRRLTPLVAQDLSAGDVLRLANIELVQEPSTQNLGKEGSPESTATLARRLVNDLFGAHKPGEVARLVVMGGPADGHQLRLETMGRRYRVGRGAGCNLAVADDDISREHAELERRWDGVFLRDLHSKNGTLVMGTRLVGERRLVDGDVLQMGQTSFRLDDPEDRYLRQMAEADPAQVDVGSSDNQNPLDTHTSARATGAAGQGQSARMAAAGQGQAAAQHSSRLGRPQGISRHGPLVLAVIATLVLVGVVGLALYFLIGK